MISLLLFWWSRANGAKLNIGHERARLILFMQANENVKENENDEKMRFLTEE